MECVNELELNILTNIVYKYNKHKKIVISEAIENIFKRCLNFSKEGCCSFSFNVFKLRTLKGVEIFLSFDCGGTDVRLMLIPDISGELYLSDVIDIY